MLSVIEVSVGEYGSDIDALVQAAANNQRPSLPHMDHEVPAHQNGRLAAHITNSVSCYFRKLHLKYKFIVLVWSCQLALYKFLKMSIFKVDIWNTFNTNSTSLFTHKLFVLLLLTLIHFSYLLPVFNNWTYVQCKIKD